MLRCSASLSLTSNLSLAVVCLDVAGLYWPVRLRVCGLVCAAALPSWCWSSVVVYRVRPYNCGTDIRNGVWSFAVILDSSPHRYT